MICKEKIDYAEFAEKVKELLEKSGYEAHVGTVVKPNDTIFHSIHVTEQGKNVSPTFYAEMLYNHFEVIELSANFIVEQMKMFSVPFDNDISKLHDFNYVKDKLSYKLINTEMNKRYLRDKVSREFLDLSIVPYIAIPSSEEYGSVMVTKNLLENWNVTKEEVLDIAMENRKTNEPVIIVSMAEILREMGMDLGFEEEEDGIKMYVLKNQSGIYGAKGFCDSDILKIFAEKVNSNVAILPSSVHELILVPCDEIDVDYVKIVKQVNATEVKEDEILSNNAYFYRADTETVSVISLME